MIKTVRIEYSETQKGFNTDTRLEYVFDTGTRQTAGSFITDTPLSNEQIAEESQKLLKLARKVAHEENLQKVMG